MIESSKLIAEFMGLEYTSSLDKERGGALGWWKKGTPIKLRQIPTYYKLPNYIGRSHNCLRYNSSWDWLMSVVEKIESMGYTTLIKNYGDEYSNFVEILNTDEDPLQITCMVAHVDESSKLELTHLAVVEFIKWYNNQK